MKHARGNEKHKYAGVGQLRSLDEHLPDHADEAADHEAQKIRKLPFISVQPHGVGDARDALGLHGACGAEHRSGTDEQHLAKFPALHALHQPSAGDGGDAAAAAAARVGVLFLIKQRGAAVHQLFRRQGAAALAEELQEYLAADPTEVAGGDEVEIIRRRSYRQMRAYG